MKQRILSLLLCLPLATLATETSWHHDVFLSLKTTDYGSDNLRDDGIEAERASVRLDGYIGDHAHVRITADAVGIDTQNGLEEAWLAFEWAHFTRLTLGQMKIPMGEEYSITEEDLPFIGYSFPAYLTGRTDSGIRIENEVRDGLLTSELAVTGGWGFDRNGQEIDGEMLAGRLTSFPLIHVSENSLFQFLSGLFIAGAYQHTWDYEGELDITSPTRNKLFDTELIRADEQSFYHISWGLDLGRVRWLHEFARGSLNGVDDGDGGSLDFDDQLTTWAASLSVRFGGEAYDSRPYRLPHYHPAGSPPEPQLEFALRYTNADIDRDLIRTGITDFDTSSQEFRVITAAVNWRFCSTAQITLQTDRTIADQMPRALGNTDRDTSYSAQLKMHF